jgi:hypothetical protein
MEPSLEVLLEKALKGAKAQSIFEGFPEALDEGDGADLTGVAPQRCCTPRRVRSFRNRESVNWEPWSETKWRGGPNRRHAARKSFWNSREEGSAGKTRAARGIREKASRTTAVLKWKKRNKPGTSVRSANQTWFEYRARTARPGDGREVGAGCDKTSRRILRTVSRESSHPARARVWAMSWLPPKPTSAMV